VDSDDTKGVSVFPDVIVHHRGTPNNFLVIEAKTSSNHEECKKTECACDLCKLRAYKTDLTYTHAFYVVFPVGEKLKNFSDPKLEESLVEIK
jgi:hypothetical protein